MNRVMYKTVPVLLLTLALLSSLYFLVRAIQGSEQFNRLYLWLFGASILAVVVLLVIIVQRLVWLYLRRRDKEPGIQLTSRMVVNFIGLSLPPVVVVYLFANLLVNSYIDAWFDAETDSALNDALSLGRIFLDTQTKSALTASKNAATQLSEIDPLRQSIHLERMLDESKAVSMSLYDTDGSLVANSSIDPLNIGAQNIRHRAFSSALSGLNYARIEPTEPNKLQIRVLVPVENKTSISLGRNRVLQAMYAIPDEYEALATNIETQYHLYNRQRFQRTQLKKTFSIVLAIVLLISLLLAMLRAFSSARRLVAPIRLLSAATKAITEGEYGKRIPVTSKDELGLLVESFNSMSSQIATASALAHRAQTEAENQRAYLEKVLSHLSSGVLSLDAEHRIRMSNEAASNILKLDKKNTLNQNIDFLAIKNASLTPFVDLLKKKVDDHATNWQQEVLIAEDSFRRVLVVRGSRFKGLDTESSGMVVVFDDETIINQAQRDAAWSEVARRLAHEVKNPLTPIQLAAERLRMKFLGKLSQEEDELLDRATQTIVSQVENLKTLVNAFSDYAKPPELKRELGGLNTLILEVVDLYQTSHPGIAFELGLEEPEPRLLLDKGRFFQLMNNLIKNAQESVEHNPVRIAISTHSEEDELVLRISDNGHGFRQDIIDHVFEPYETTKTGGSGLGLAIVKKIVEEHGGEITAGNLADGALITIRLPTGY